MPWDDEQIETREAMGRTVDIHEKHNNPTIKPQRDIDKPKHSPTIMLAGHGRQYKSTIVKLMNDYPHLSKIDLKVSRIWKQVNVWAMS